MKETTSAVTLEDQAPVKDASPADNAGKEGRTFTQDEVNKIVSDRLNREREKAPDQMAAREHDLTIREERLKCREFLAENKDTYPADLLDVLDTGDFEAFKASAEKIAGAFESFHKDRKPAGGFQPMKVGATPTHGGYPLYTDGIADAFKPPKG